MISPSTVYGGIEAYLERAMPLMLVLAALLIAVTVYLALYRRDPVLLAAWLTYMFMP